MSSSQLSESASSTIIAESENTALPTVVSQNDDADNAQFIEHMEIFLAREKLEQDYEPVMDRDVSITTTVSTQDSILDQPILPSSIASLGINGESQKITAVAQDKESFMGLSELWIARILLLLSAALYGTNFTMVKILDETVPVGAAAMMRFGLAALVTSPFLFISTKTGEVDSEGNVEKEKFDWKTALPVAVLGFEVGLWNSVGYIAQAVGLETTEASKSAFICSLAVVVVPILDALSGKKLSPKSIVGIICAVLGVAFLELEGGISNFHLDAGDLLTFVQPIAFGMGFWRMEHAMRLYPTEALRLTASQLSAVGVMSALYCFMGYGGVAPPTIDQMTEWVMNGQIFGAIIWTGLVTTAFTIYMETRALRTLTAAEATLLFSTEPLWGSAFAAFVVGERFGMGAVFGAALILSGCIVSNLPDDAAKDESEEFLDTTQSYAALQEYEQFEESPFESISSSSPYSAVVDTYSVNNSQNDKSSISPDSIISQSVGGGIIATTFVSKLEEVAEMVVPGEIDVAVATSSELIENAIDTVSSVGIDNLIP